MNANKILLGTGRLTWDRMERVSDRYGFVYLMEYGDSMSPHKLAPLTIPKEHLGKRGSFMAHVIETRQSTHIGDLFRKIFPVTPKVGDDIMLGYGVLEESKN